jgi:hypothetical protein
MVRAVVVSNVNRVGGVVCRSGEALNDVQDKG